MVGALIDQVKHSCKFIDQGSEVKMTLKDLVTHEKLCPEKCVRNIIQMTLRVSERSLPRESKRLVVLSDEISHILRNEVTSNKQSDIRELVEKLMRY